MAQPIVSVLPHALDFTPRRFQLTKTFGQRRSLPIELRRGFSRLLFVDQGLFFYNGPDEALLEVVVPPDATAARLSISLAGYGAGNDGAVLIDQQGQLYRWRPGAGPVLAWATGMRGLDVMAIGLSSDRLLVQRAGNGDGMQTELVDTRAREVRWTRPLALVTVVPCETALIAQPFATPRTVICLDRETGETRWQHEARHDLRDLIGVVGECVWISTQAGSIFALRLTDGTEQSAIGLKDNSVPQGVLDPRGRLHVCNGLNYHVLDLTNGQARVESAVFFENRPDAPTTALGRLSLPTTDGRLIFMDDRGRVYVVPPEHPTAPQCIWSDSRVFNIGVVQQSLVLLDWDSRLTILSADG